MPLKSAEAYFNYWPLKWHKNLKTHCIVLYSMFFHKIHRINFNLVWRTYSRCWAPHFLLTYQWEFCYLIYIRHFISRPCKGNQKQTNGRMVMLMNQSIFWYVPWASFVLVSNAFQSMPHKHKPMLSFYLLLCLILTNCSP